MVDGDHFDLIFMDIIFDVMDGMTAGRKIREELKNEDVHIVFVSAIRDYAMDLFDLRPLNFLVKPVKQEDVIKCVEKARRLTESRNQCFEFRNGKEIFRVPYGKIRYFESDNRKVIIRMETGSEEMYGKLNEIELKTPINFIRVHQSYLINCKFAQSFSVDKVTMSDGTVFSISRRYRGKVKKDLMNFLSDK